MSNKYANRTPSTFEIWGEFWIVPDTGEMLIGGWEARRIAFKELGFTGPIYERCTFRRWTTEEKREIRKLSAEPDTRSNSWITNVDNLLYYIPQVLLIDWSLTDEDDKPVPLVVATKELALSPGRGVYSNMLTDESFAEWKSIPTPMQDYFASRARAALDNDGAGDKDPRLEPDRFMKNLEDDGTINRATGKEEKVESPNPFSVAGQTGD